MAERNTLKAIHECEFYLGKISDVTIRKGTKSIHCRKCGERLKECEVNEEMLKKIKKMFEDGGRK